MRFIRDHALVHLLSPVKTPSDGLHIYIVLFRTALLGVGRRGRVSSHKVYTRPLERLASTHWIFYTVHSNTLGICLRWILGCVWSGQSIEGSAPFLRILWFLNVSDVFWGGSKVVGGCFIIVPKWDGSFVPSDLLGGIHSCLWVIDRLTARMVAFLWDLACPSVPCCDRGSKVLG